MLKHIESIPTKLVEEYSMFAENVFKCTTQTQKNIYVIHGPYSDHGNKEYCPRIDENYAENEYYVPSNTVNTNQKKELIHIHFASTIGSIILNGLQNNTIIICNKVNHILMRLCSNINVYIKKGTVSGVDILKCQNSFIKMPSHNYTNVEYGDNIHFQANMNNISQVSVIGSIDITSNGISLPVNPFVNVVITKNNMFHRKCPYKSILFIDQL